MSPPIDVWNASLPGWREAGAGGAARRGGLTGGRGWHRGCGRRCRDLLNHRQSRCVAEQPGIRCRQPAVVALVTVSDPQPPAIRAASLGPERLCAGRLRHDRSISARLGAQSEREALTQGQETVLRHRQRGGELRRGSNRRLRCGERSRGRCDCRRLSWRFRRSLCRSLCRGLCRGLCGRGLRRQQNRRGRGQGRRARDGLAAAQSHQRNYANSDNPAQPPQLVFHAPYLKPSHPAYCQPRNTHHASRITHHVTRITHHASRITHHASRFSSRTAAPRSDSTAPPALPGRCRRTTPPRRRSRSPAGSPAV